MPTVNEEALGRLIFEIEEVVANVTDPIPPNLAQLASVYAGWIELPRNIQEFYIGKAQKVLQTIMEKGNVHIVLSRDSEAEGQKSPWNAS